MFLVALLFHLRNRYAHGRLPGDHDEARYDELNRVHTTHAATLILAALIGDDLLSELGVDLSCPVLGMSDLRQEHGLGSTPVNDALLDWKDLLDCLEAAIVPAAERSETSTYYPPEVDDPDG